MQTTTIGKLTMSFSSSIIYVAFFGLIGAAVYLTNSAMPLWALLFMPSITTTKSKEE